MCALCHLYHTDIRNNPISPEGSLNPLSTPCTPAPAPPGSAVLNVDTFLKLHLALDLKINGVTRCVLFWL